MKIATGFVLICATLFGLEYLRPVSWSQTSAAPATGQSNLALLLTDIHLDPLTSDVPTTPPPVQQLENATIDKWPAILAQFQTKISAASKKNGAPRVDANYPLVDTALKSAADSTLTHAPFDYVIFTGDMIEHGFPRGNAAEQLLSQNAARFLLRTMQQRFNAPIFAALGNNDSDRCDYGIMPGDPFLGAVADEMVVLNANTPASRTANVQFRKTGYYSLPHPTVANQDILVLNSVYWSKSYMGSAYGCPNSYSDAPGKDELLWFEKQLSMAAQNHHGLTLVMHAPPGVDPISTSQGQPSSLFWTQDFNDRFAGLIKQYSAVIPVAFAGHSHLDDFRFFDEIPSVPWKIALAVSPWFGNNSGFSTFSYDPKSAALTDVTTYVGAPGSPSWKMEYDFNAAYQVSGFSAGNLGTINTAFRNCKSKGCVRDKFEEYYKPGTATVSNLSNLACAEQYYSPSLAKKCIDNWP